MPSFVHRLTSRTEFPFPPRTEVVLATLQLPAGSYIVQAKADTIHSGGGEREALLDYSLIVGSSATDRAFHRVPPSIPPSPGRTVDQHHIHLVVATNLTNASTAQFSVNTGGSTGGEVHNVVLIAQSVETLTITEAPGELLGGD
jgi:hypothetical protein